MTRWLTVTRALLNEGLAHSMNVFATPTDTVGMLIPLVTALRKEMEFFLTTVVILGMSTQHFGASRSKCPAWVDRFGIAL